MSLSKGARGAPDACYSADVPSPYRLLVPIFIIACGGLFLLDSWGVAGLAWAANIFWPGLLIGFGLEAWGAARRRWGGALMLAGGLLWLDNFDYLHWHLERFWPLALVATGVCLIARNEA